MHSCPCHTHSTYIVLPWCSNTPCQYALVHLRFEKATQRSSSPQCFDPPASLSGPRSLSRRETKASVSLRSVTQHVMSCCYSCRAFSHIPCIGCPSCERIRIQWSDMLRITRGCKATETLPVTPAAITLGLATVTQTQNDFHNTATAIIQ